MDRWIRRSVWTSRAIRRFRPIFGVSVNIPLRIFDRNQGEKLRTQEDITRNERLRDAATAQVFSDVDSAYATVQSNLALLRPYKDTYLKEAVEVRDTVSFAYKRGGASLLDFLEAQKDYRSTELNYLNLVGSYLTAAAQLNHGGGPGGYSMKNPSMMTAAGAGAGSESGAGGLQRESGSQSEDGRRRPRPR